MLKLKSVMPVIFDNTVNVSVAVALAPAVNCVPPLSHDSVIGPLAFRLQLFVVRDNVTGLVPVFLMYIVLFVVLPGATVDQFIDVQFCVQAASL